MKGTSKAKRESTLLFAVVEETAPVYWVPNAPLGSACLMGTIKLGNKVASAQGLDVVVEVVEVVVVTHS